MHKNYTPETLLQFVYKELTAREMVEVRHDLQVNVDLANEFHQICESLDLLTDLDMQPSNSSIEIIMEHSLMAHETTT